MTKVPKPGQPVRGSRSGKPIMALFDLLGRSWALGIIWQLAEAGALRGGRCGLTFRALQERCEGVSPTVLNRRLKELSASKLVERGAAGYQLSAKGSELFQLLQPFGEWSTDWAAKLDQ
ncbi:transcriptional regulator, partial [Roseobacter sp. SK209-2-6]|uniref:winged helix-turn-helix transcriptional regulator n=1 Tax=Roseobacter sp. SK209-2-6 TaxID=388739 RepID=UPI0000F3DF50